MNSEYINLQIHPRGIEALGKDLVTNNVVAIIELVKNSYDAFAKNVQIDFDQDKNGPYIQISDDGIGMDKDIIKNVWAVIATPYKSVNTYTKLGNKQRRVTGEKGLGRLSLARLGGIAQIATKTKKSTSELQISWEKLFKEDNFANCKIQLNDQTDASFLSDTGTTIKICNLHDKWSDDDIFELEENLSRIVSPFAPENDFNISLKRPNELAEIRTKIESPKFLDIPKYKILGNFDTTTKRINYTYIHYNLQQQNIEREIKDVYTWEQFYSDLHDREKAIISEEKPKLGTFTFEIRAWDIDSTNIQEISTLYNIEKKKVRLSIRAHKGISLYRDEILVLPKTDNNRDWLGLDLRRVSSVGKRLSTSQIVGYVSVQADSNPNIRDASDREKLVSNNESIEFQELLIKIVQILEKERGKDKENVDQNPSGLEDLFDGLDASSIIDELEELSEIGASAETAVPLLRDFQNDVEKVKKKIQERFIYYSRLATVGTIAQYIVHEIRNRTTILSELIETIKKELNDRSDKMNKYLSLSEKSISNLERLADTFAPLANRTFSKRRRNSDWKDTLNNCLFYFEKDIAKKKIEVSINSPNYTLEIDPAELETILINLINNSIYWLSKNTEERKIILDAKRSNKRLEISFSDNGPGIFQEDLRKVLLPGITRKPDGIGMGLTVVSELVLSYNGKIAVKDPGAAGGATFVFDLPIKE